MDVSSICLRVMTMEDLPAVVRIEKACFPDPWGEQTFRHDLADENYFYLAALADRKLAGYCGYLKSFDTADIVNVAVDPVFQGKGIGTLLLKALLDHGREEGISTFFLEVRESNGKAIHLYRNAGFEQIGIRKKYYSDPVEDALILSWQEDG